MIGLIWGSLRNVVILTVFAAEVAACAGKGEARGARMEVVQRLFLDGVDGEGTGLAVDFADEHAGVVAAAAAHTGLAVGNVAVVGAQITLDCPILQTIIIFSYVLFHYILSLTTNLDEFHELDELIR